MPYLSRVVPDNISLTGHPNSFGSSVRTGVGLYYSTGANQIRWCLGKGLFSRRVVGRIELKLLLRLDWGRGKGGEENKKGHVYLNLELFDVTLLCLVHSISVLIFLRAFFPYGIPHFLTVSLPTTPDDDDDNFIRLSIYRSSSYVNDTRMDLHTHVHKYLSVCT